MLQSSIEPPAGHGDSRTLRLVRFDVTDPRTRADRRVRLPARHARRRRPASSRPTSAISDIYAIDATHLLVDEHDNVTDVPGAGQKRIYEVDLAGATNIAGDAAANGEDPQLEATNAAGVTPVAKTQWLDLGAFGYNHDKPEGIGLFPNGDLAVQDDNDFGFAQGNDPQSPAPATRRSRSRAAATRRSCGASTRRTSRRARRRARCRRRCR